METSYFTMICKESMFGILFVFSSDVFNLEIKQSKLATQITFYYKFMCIVFLQYSSLFWPYSGRVLLQRPVHHGLNHSTVAKPLLWKTLDNHVHLAIMTWRVPESSRKAMFCTIINDYAENKHDSCRSCGARVKLFVLGMVLEIGHVREVYIMYQ